MKSRTLVGGAECRYVDGFVERVGIVDEFDKQIGVRLLKDFVRDTFLYLGNQRLFGCFHYDKNKHLRANVYSFFKATKKGRTISIAGDDFKALVNRCN